METVRTSGRPLVAIVGRPNVGKSSLFNRLIGDRRAIVEDTPGVTRDRLVLPLHWEAAGLDFDLMDTGGIGVVDRADLADSVEYQVLTGIHAADLVLVLVDAREGITLLDERVAGLVRRSDRPLLLLANKCEGRAAERNLPEFSSLGLGDALPVSAQEGYGLGDLAEAMAGFLPPAAEVDSPAGGALQIAVLGRRNTGKSSFINSVVGEQRVIVSEVAGTTRDAVDVDFEYGGRRVTLVDTAGVHRRGKVANAIEFFSLTRSDQAIRRADVALLFLDLTQPVARMDQEVARRLADRYKPAVVVGTKHDLRPEISMRDFRDTVEHKLPHLAGAPLCMLSNLTGKGVPRAMQFAFDLHAEASRRISTGELNRVAEAVFDAIPFRGRGEKPRLFYTTQIRVSPPTFLLFVNRTALFRKESLRAIGRQLRKRLDYERVPVRLVLRDRERSPAKR